MKCAVARLCHRPWVLPVLISLACQRDPARDPENASGRVDAGNRVAVAAPPSPGVPGVGGSGGSVPVSAADAPVSGEKRDAGAADAGPAVEGTWTETSSYKLRLEDVKACGVALPEKATWVGFLVRVGAKVSETLVSPRDLTLERGGVILSATYVDPPKLAGCAPLLAPKQLRAGQTNRGFVLFQVPADFRAAATPLSLAYRPTRWGGAPRVDVRIPNCLDACPPPEPEGSPRRPGRAGSRATR